MSISPNVGALSMYLHRLRLEPAYTTPKDYLAHVLKQLPGFGTRLYNVLSRIEGSLKYLLTPGMLFEEFGFKYFGPVDGYDFETLERALIRARERKGPVLVHVLTAKGIGYKPAQEQCNKFHGIGPFEIETGKVKKSKNGPVSYTEVFGNVISEMATRDQKIVAITSAMKEGTGLNRFATEHPARFYDVGIAEQHAVTMAAGMARGGLRPYVAIYSTFMQRALDQVIHDIAMMDLPVVLCLDRAGIVGEDGPTHHGVFDLSFLRMIPGVDILSPGDEIELEMMLRYSADTKRPLVIRYPRGTGVGSKDNCNNRRPIIRGKAEIVKEGTDLAIFALGNCLSEAINAANDLDAQGIKARVINPRFVKPFDRNILADVIKRRMPIVTIEEHALAGGFGSMILETAAELGNSAKILRIGIPDDFVQHGTQKELRALLKLDSKGIYQQIFEWFSNKKKLKIAV
jgi:1-deoxy-D-xylulose-5-phosphate synthase